MIWLLLIVALAITGFWLVRSKKADLNNDGVVNAQDAVEAAQKVADKVTKMADIDDDSKITLDDVKKASSTIKNEAVRVKRKYNKKK